MAVMRCVHVCMHVLCLYICVCLLCGALCGAPALPLPLQVVQSGSQSIEMAVLEKGKRLKVWRGGGGGKHIKCNGVASRVVHSCVLPN